MDRVLSPGEMLARAKMRRGARLLDAVENYLITVELAELDVEHVRLYALDRMADDDTDEGT